MTKHHKFKVGDLCFGVFSGSYFVIIKMTNMFCYCYYSDRGIELFDKDKYFNSASKAVILIEAFE